MERIPLEWLPSRCIDFARERFVFRLLIREHPPFFSDNFA